MAKNTNANYWISQRKSGEWSVQKENGSRSSGEVIVKNCGGLIREKNTYGKPDPRETKG